MVIGNENVYIDKSLPPMYKYQKTIGFNLRAVKTWQHVHKSSFAPSLAPKQKRYTKSRKSPVLLGISSALL